MGGVGAARSSSVGEDASDDATSNASSTTPSFSSSSPNDSHLIQLLSIWHRYVNWTEQNYPSGKELGEILQRSLQAFPEATGEMALVADQLDYVDLWMKLANQREEPGDIFQFMYSKKIGRKCGVFYEQWAWHLEDVGNTKKASAVLSKGIVNVGGEIGGSTTSTTVSLAEPSASSSSPASSSSSSSVVRLEKLKA